MKYDAEARAWCEQWQTAGAIQSPSAPAHLAELLRAAERAGAERMRERAAEACRIKRKEYARLATRSGYAHCHDRADGAGECVGLIRALPLDGGDEA